MSDRARRRSILASTAPLPGPLRVRSRQRLLSRLEGSRIRRADLLFVAHPKSGTTWLRVMISRLYQNRYGFPSSLLVKSDELARRDPSLPSILATNGHYSYEGVLEEALAGGGPEPDLSAKKLLFLARHPCDVAVSWYFQFTKRQSRWKQELINHSIPHPIDRHEVSMWDFVMKSDIGLPSLVDYLNRWEAIVARMPRSRVVRYEDLRARPAETLREVMDLVGGGFSDAEIREAVSFGSFDNLRRLETAGHFRGGGLRLRNAADPETLKVRRGKVGGYRDYFEPEQVAEMEKLVAERLSTGLGYTEPAGGGPDAVQRRDRTA